MQKARGYRPEQDARRQAGHRVAWVATRVLFIMLIVGLGSLLDATANAANKPAASEIIAFERSVATMTTPDAIADAFTEDARQYDPAIKSPSIGRAAILAHLTDQMAQVKGVTTEIVSISADAQGNLGYSVSEQKGVLTMKDGKTTNFHIWAMHVLRKTAGKWKILIEQIAYLS